MRAVRSLEPGGPETLRVENVPQPEPGPGQVRIKVRAAAINFPDLLQIQDLYQGRMERPFTPGSEASGVVDAIGTGVVGLTVGDRVIGLASSGALAEKFVVEATDCHPIPEAVEFEPAAALLVTFATSYYALRDQADLQRDEILVVLGASGGAGGAAVQLGKSLGAFVVAGVSSQAKADVARSLGADAVVVYPESVIDPAAKRAFSDALRAACPKGHCDVVFDPVGGAYAEPAFRTLGWRGRHLVVGFTAGIASLPMNLALLKGARLIGVFYGAFAKLEPERARANLSMIAAMMAEGEISPFISMRLPLERAAEGFVALADRTSVGKIVITF